jgi:hypothetical protein
MTRKALFPLLITLATLGCTSTDPVASFFDEKGYSYPYHALLTPDGSPKWVCPDKGERLSPEHATFVGSGSRFIASAAGAKMLQSLQPDAEAFLIKDPFVLAPSCYSRDEFFAVSVFAYSSPNGSPEEITVPHRTIRMGETAILEIHNILLLRKDDQRWTFNGWVY